MDLYALAARYVNAIVDLLNQHGPIDKIVSPAYNREEYNERHKALGDLSCMTISGCRGLSLPSS